MKQVRKTHPWKRPAHALLVRVNLGGGGAGDAGEGGGAGIEVDEGGDVVGEEGARGTAGFPGGAEHEVVDYELAVRPEEVRKRDGLLIAGRVKRGECVWLGDFDDRQVAALGGDGVVGAGDVLFFLEERQAGGAMLGRRGDLRRRGRLGWCSGKRREGGKWETTCENWRGQGIL